MSMEHSHEHFSQGASCCAGGCCSGSCCGSGDAIRPVPAVLGIALFVAALVMGSDSWSGMAAYAAAYLLIGWDVLKAAFLGLRHGRAMDENFLMSIASLGAMFLGDYSEAVGVMLFYRVGEYLQERAVGSSRRSVSELMNLRPESVHVREGGTVRDVPPAEVMGSDSWSGMAAYAAAYLLIGWDVLKAAFLGLRHGRAMDENFLMSIASLGAMFLGDYSEAVGVMLFYRVGEYLQERAVGSSRRSVSELMNLRPESVHVREGGTVRDVPPAEVRPGSVIEVRPGERVPLDGTVTEGNSVLDTSAMTGESLPVEAGAGSTVLAGYINGQGVLEVRTDRDWRHSALARVQELVEAASGHKSPLEGRLSTFSRIYTPLVISIAVLVFLLYPFVTGGSWTDGLFRALVLLVISCPCALVLSIPLGFFAGIGRAARQGILLKGSNYLDALRKVKTVVFDKTGTLTEGVFSVDEVLPRDGVTPEELLYWAAHAESSASHPLGRSIVKAYEGSLFPDRVAELVEVTGGGVSARVEGKAVLVGKKAFLQEAGVEAGEEKDRGVTIYVALDGVLLGRLRLSDRIKPGAEQAVRELRGLGVSNLVMLTGDSSSAGAEVGRKLGLDEVFSGLMPAGKLEHVRRLKPEEGLLAFVGDGMNDAPSLAAADIGIAMGGVGSDTALQAADVVVMKGDPVAVPQGMVLSRATERIIVQNIVLILGVKLLVMVLGILGLAGMWAAVMADVGVCLLAVGNSMRIFRVKLDA